MPRFLSLAMTAISFLMAGRSVDLCAEEWPQFRGPQGDGHTTATGLPTHWGVDQNVTWKQKIPGLGWSSPVVLGDRVYLTTAVEQEQKAGSEPAPKTGSGYSLRAVCLDAESGATRWDVEVFLQKPGRPGADRIHNKNSHASPTPVTDGKHLFVHYGTHGTACLTLSGKIVWKTRELEYKPVHGNGGSPVLVDDKLVVSCDGGDVEFIVALDKKTGDIRWKTDRTATDLRKTFAFGTPLVISVEGETQVVSQGAGAVYAYRPEDGSVIWKVDYGSGYSVVPRPVYAHGLVYVSSGFDRAKLFSIDPTGEGDITDTHVRWIITKGAPHTPSPLVIGDELYLVSDRGVLTCADAVSGETHYQERLGGKYSASPLYGDGKIYVQSEGGKAIVFRPGTTYDELAQNELEGRIFASYAVYDSSLLILTEEQLYRIGK